MDDERVGRVELSTFTLMFRGIDRPIVRIDIPDGLLYERGNRHASSVLYHHTVQESEMRHVLSFGQETGR